MGTIDSLMGGFDLSGILAGLFPILILIVAGIGAVVFIWWFYQESQYNVKVEIWCLREGDLYPQIEEKIIGGIFLKKGIESFELKGKRFENAVIQIDKNHIIRTGNQRKLFLRREGDRYYFSFIPKLWVNKDGIKNIILEVEDADVVNRAIIKDRQIAEKLSNEDLLQKYGALIIGAGMLITLIIVVYLTFQYLSGTVNTAISQVENMRQTCSQAISQGGW